MAVGKGPPTKMPQILSVDGVAVDESQLQSAPLHVPVFTAEVGEGKGVADAVFPIPGDQFLTVTRNKHHLDSAFTVDSECLHHPPMRFHPEFGHCQPDFEQITKTNQDLGVLESFQHFDELFKRSLLKVQMGVCDNVKGACRLFDAEGWNWRMHRTAVSGDQK